MESNEGDHEAEVYIRMISNLTRRKTTTFTTTMMQGFAMIIMSMVL